LPGVASRRGPNSATDKNARPVFRSAASNCASFLIERGDTFTVAIGREDALGLPIEQGHVRIVADWNPIDHCECLEIEMTTDPGSLQLMNEPASKLPRDGDSMNTSCRNLTDQATSVEIEHGYASIMRNVRPARIAIGSKVVPPVVARDEDLLDLATVLSKLADTNNPR
jgi:hypothetical protein